MSSTILVTGATGTIGRELVTQLKAAGAHVIAGSASGKAVEGVETRHADFADPASLANAFRGVDTLFLLLPLQADMVTLAGNAVVAARAAGVRHIVRSSGAGADPDAPFAIGRVQGEIDRLVTGSGVAYTITRPNCFMQNFVTFYADMIRAGALYLPQGDGKVSFVDVRDIAAVNAAILLRPDQHAGRTYDVTGGEALSNADVTARIGAALGRKVDYVAVSDDAAIASMRDAGVDAWSIDTLMSLSRLIAAGHAAAVSADVRTLLGRAPIAFERFVEDYVGNWR
ncbi:NAD(P)-dependent oxidoreductase [Burkholderia ubonensis]|uniref:SDR family oxidoreductase n=1 Tax=Burkholderia ubonensis TaxID=101571 RepID=UPI0007538A25|nr:SDR family oxidoreductase [Burkholderia ubonensis]KVW65801.1 NAD(P)-dependent oxidoreductase [Burkholderia ubonensis]KVX93536.1 NAD(P)-dependent oxidoreductase [Burkholderia ubonensis]